MIGYGNCFPEWCDLAAPGIVKALKSRGFDAYYCKTGAKARDLAVSLIPEGSVVSWGGSVTTRQIGLTEALANGSYEVIDRDIASTPEERDELGRKALFCDTYLTSVNAISEDGQLVNVDGMGNRVAAITFGPKSVIAVVGMNKVCKTERDAYARARNFASPMNVVRLGVSGTPCSVTGTCADCKTDACICCSILTTRYNRVPGRIKVILVGEPLGY